MNMKSHTTLKDESNNDYFTKNMNVNKQNVLVFIYELNLMYILLCIQIIF